MIEIQSPESLPSQLPRKKQPLPASQPTLGVKPQKQVVTNVCFLVIEMQGQESLPSRLPRKKQPPPASQPTPLPPPPPSTPSPSDTEVGLFLLL